MKLKPLNDRVVVEPLEPETKTAGGIVLPDTAKEKPKQGRVVATGPGKITDDGKRQPIEVKEGDTVVYGSFAGTEVRIDGTDLLVLREEDILGVIEGAPKKLKAGSAGR